MNGDNDYGKSHIIGEWEVKSQRDYITITNGPKRYDFVFDNRTEIRQVLCKVGVEPQVSNRKRRPTTIR